MDARYINAVLKAVKNVFMSIAKLTFSQGAPSLKKDKKLPHKISVAVEFSGGITGCVVVSMSEETALKLASSLLGEEMNEFDEQCVDAVGEVASIAAGNSKRDFPKEGITFSAPTVIIGNQEYSYPDIPVISFPCETPKGGIVVDIAFKES